MIDLLVIGGGPIGLASAIEARLAGLSVVVLEQRPGVIDKACGEGLMPGAMPLLERLGVDPAGMPLHGVSYRAGARRADHRFRTGTGRGVRRLELHSALAARAELLGVEVLRAKVEEIRQSSDSVEAAGIRARWAFGADGLHSLVRRQLGLDRVARGIRRYGLRRHFEIEPWNDLIEVHWSEQVEAYVTPVAPNLVGIAVLGRQGLHFETALESVPELRDRLTDATPATKLQGAGALRQRSAAPSRGRVLLVGDASGYVDAITGEGLRLGFEQARVAVASITGGEPYDREWRRVTRDFRVLTSSLVAAATTPLRGAIVPAAARLPGVYGAVVERLAR